MTTSGLSIVAYTDSVDEVGGAEQSLGNLLAALDSPLDVTVMGVRGDLIEALAARRPGGAGTCVVPRVANKHDLRAIQAHVGAVRRLRPQVFHANLASTAACMYGILSALLVPKVRAIAVEQSPIPLTDRAQLRFKQVLSRRLAAHVGVGERSARSLEESLALPPGSVRTIYNGVPELDVEPLPRRWNGPVVGAMGRLSHEKGFGVLVRALPLLPGVTAVLVGDGAERTALEQTAAELHVSDRLVITGWTDEARRYLPTFDVLAVPSHFEGFPLVVVEAMLAGLAVVATRVGSIPEAVGDGETGLLVPPDNPEALAAALRRLLDDEPCRQAMGERGRTTARERFTAATMARAFEALYAEIVR